jgi:hypothetical protein
MMDVSTEENPSSYESDSTGTYMCRDGSAERLATMEGKGKTCSPHEKTRRKKKELLWLFGLSFLP